MTRNVTSVALLSLVIATGCMQNPAGAKSRDLESEIQAGALADSDLPADSYTRHVAIQGPIGFGETVEGHYASGGYAAWVFTASAGARVALDVAATDSSDTVLALYGPQNGSSWTGARAIAVNDDYRGSTNSHIDHRVTRAGTYLVLVREYWDAGGNFNLTLACSGSSECRQECGTSCPTGSTCNRIVCIRAPCPSYCAPTPAMHAGDACTDTSLCGIAPRIATLMCEDGSVGGFTGNCIRNADLTTCHWEIRSCPPPACPPNTLLCVRGSHYDGTPGVCGCVPDACPPNMYLCIVGYHYDGTPGVCGCVPDAVGCGARLGNTCSATEYCNFSASAMCGRADATGTCATRPQLCPAIYLPVCGCDGMTYSNSCHANSVGQGVLHTGPC